METAFAEVTERPKYHKYDHPRIERSGKDNERTEEEWNDNKPPTIDNVRRAIERLKNNRSTEPDSIITELLKIKQEMIQVTFHKMVCQIWKVEIIPEQWKDGLSCCVHKNGDQLELNTGYTRKIFCNVLYEGLQPYMENIVGKYQCGFIKGKSTRRLV
jgi:hypothetical protein